MVAQLVVADRTAGCRRRIYPSVQSVEAVSHPKRKRVAPRLEWVRSELSLRPVCRSRIAALALLMVTLYACNGGADDQADGSFQDPTKNPQLVLRQDPTVPLPERYSVSGISIGPKGNVLVWSRSSSRGFVLRDGGEWDSVELLAAQPLAVRLVEISPQVHLEVLDRQTHSLMEVVDGRLVRSQPLINPIPVEAAVWIDPGGWAVARISGGTLMISNIDQNGADASPHSLTWTSDGGVHLSQGHGGALLASEIRPPHRIWLIGAESGDLTAVQCAVHDGSGSSSYVALPVLAVSGGMLQVLADQASFKRILRKFDDQGSCLGSVEVEGVPFGLVTASLDQSTVYGMQVVDTPELLSFHVE